MEEVEVWFDQLDQETAQLVTGALDLLEMQGPHLGRPMADTLRGSELANLKELLPGSAGSSEIRILFAFDPDRNAILLVAGDKSTAWRQWYKTNIPIAEERFKKWLAGDYND